MAKCATMMSVILKLLRQTAEEEYRAVKKSDKNDRNQNNIVACRPIAR
jgi:hypothetical protein